MKNLIGADMFNEIKNDVIELYNWGETIDDISRQLNLSKFKVILILCLNRWGN